MAPGIADELHDKLVEIGEKYEIEQIFLTNGNAGDTLTCKGNRDKDKIITYVIPDGYEFYDLDKQLDAEGRGSNANAYKYNEDPHDGRVKMEVNSKLGGSAKATVSAAYAIKRS
ncbi:hypothetical protein KQI74_28140 [Paenibacillus barcinonensis]|uniref:hypothetical protein n=1 Tax=Paenibacillus barcinonensis TaxID=198119 RepID=UPI001C1070F0|nr:hypothetical protein [Paenibacillus barcinonensis]MBU5356126.1 hypothetical protein [Paenibacillus barcinonensis]